MNKKTFTIIALMTLISFINNFAHPVTPKLVESIGYGPPLLGSLFAAMSLSLGIMSPIWGWLSEKYGRKPFLILGPIGYGLAQLGFGYSTNPNLIILFRFLAGGLSCSTFVAGMAYMIDVSNHDNRTKIITLYTAVSGFAATIGNLVGGIIGNTDYHYAFLAQGSLSIFSSLIIFVFLRESHYKKHLVIRNNSFKDSSKYINTAVPFLLIITLLTSFVAIGFNTSFNSYMNFVLHLAPKTLGQVMAVTGFIGLTMNIGIFPLIKRKFNDYYSLIISIFFMFTSLALSIFFVRNHFNLTLIILVIFFAFLALYRPLLQSILSKMGRANGEIMGLNSAFNALGMVGGSYYAGKLFDINVNFTIYSLSVIGFITFGLLLSQKNKFENLG